MFLDGFSLPSLPDTWPGQDQGIGNQARAVVNPTFTKLIEFDHGNEEGGHPVSASAPQSWGLALRRSVD